MPRYDRTGPEGMGPMTGRGMGNCAGSPPAYYGRRRFGRLGMAFRHGWRRAFHPAWDRDPYWDPYERPEDEAEWLQEEEAYLEKQLKAVKDRLSAMQNTSDE